MRRIATILLLLAALPAFGQDKAWVGRTILTREFGVKITHIDDKGMETYIPLTDSIYYRVEAEKGEQIKVVTSRGVEGWLKKTDALLPEQAIGHFSAMIRKNPNDASAFQKRAFAHELQRDYDEAIKDCNDTIHLAYHDMASWNSRGLLYCAKGDYDLAIRDFTTALRYNPYAAAPYCNRGHAWTAKKQYKKAIADLNEAIRLEPTLSYAFSSRGLAAFLIKDYDNALRDFGNAQTLDPKSSQAYLHHARLLATCADAKYRNGNKAVDLAKKGLALEETPSGEARQTLAAAFAEAGDYLNAIQQQEKALEDPRLADDEDARARLDLYRKKSPYRQN